MKIPLCFEIYSSIDFSINFWVSFLFHGVLLFIFSFITLIIALKILYYWKCQKKLYELKKKSLFHFLFIINSINVLENLFFSIFS